MINRVHLQRAFSKVSDRIKYMQTPICNIKPGLLELVDDKIHEIESHPIQTLKQKLEAFYTNSGLEKSKLQTAFPSNYEFIVNNDPIVDKFRNFDSLLIPEDHVTRCFIRKAERYLLHKRRLPSTDSDLGSSKREYQTV